MAARAVAVPVTLAAALPHCRTAALPLALAADATAAPRPFGLACTAQHGVRFCPSGGLSQRVATFDGVPLDVDVTLPPATGPSRPS